MEIDILKHFIRHDVEVLVGGVWIEGVLQPIVKGVIVLLPLPNAIEFYGPASLRIESIDAIRQLKRGNPQPSVINMTPEKPAQIRSVFESVPPSKRFAVKKIGDIQ